MKRILKKLKKKFFAYFSESEKEIKIMKKEKNGLGNFLLEKGIITEQQLKTALDYQSENSHKKIGEILTDIDILGEEEVLKELSSYMEVDYIVLDNLTYPLTLQNFFKRGTMIDQLFVPFDLSGNIISIAISDINNNELKNSIEQAVNSAKEYYHISYYLSLPSMIRRFIYNSYAKHPHKTGLLSKKKRFGEYLLEKQIVTKEQLDEVLKYQHKFIHKRLGELLYEMKILEREQALKELAAHENKEYEPLDDRKPQNELIKLFDINYMKENHFVPFERENDTVKIAINNIFDDEHIEAIELKLKEHCLQARFYVSLRESIENFLDKAVGV